MMEISELVFLPGYHTLSPKAQAMLNKIILPVLGLELLDKVWDVYMYGDHPLLYKEDKHFKFWGFSDSEGHPNIPAHMINVASGCAIVARKMRLDEKQIHNLVLAGMLHDAFKRVDVEVDDREGHESLKDLLTGLFGLETALLTQYSGHNSMEHVIHDMAVALDGTGRIQIWPRLTFFLMDGIAVNSGFGTVEEKCDHLDRMFNKEGKYQYNPEGIGLWGHPYFTAQRHLSETIQMLMAKKLDILPPTALASWVNEQVEAALAE